VGRDRAARRGGCGCDKRADARQQREQDPDASRHGNVPFGGSIYERQMIDGAPRNNLTNESLQVI
jgi:hypothetical protein